MVEVFLFLYFYCRVIRDIDWWYWVEFVLDCFGIWMVFFVIYRVGKKVGGG